jgi:predicted membrane-bound dolichyl-phosphate-mannose-protein mannosyltransferase
MTTVVPELRRRLRAPVSSPLLVLAVVSILSLGARGFMLGEPCQSPCTTASEHTLIFDEAYYVNAARVIAHIRPAAGQHYDASPLGSDPNAEHPQGAKLIMAGAIELFGDGPFAWRIGSLIFGSLAILAMYALVRFSGGGRWSAVGAATLMAADNLFIVHGRIATLDIYGVAPMILGVALYMRGRPWLAAIALAVADCMKEVSPYALLVIGLLEVGRVLYGLRNPDRPPSWHWRPTLTRLAITVIGSLALFIAGLWVMGMIATPYADSERLLITGGPFDHLWHMITYAEALTSPHGPQGIASYPWQWLLDLKPITYLRVNPSLPGDGLFAIRPVVAFFGMISPPILALAIPSLAFCAYRATRRRPATQSFADVQLALLGIAWFVGTWLPYELQSALDSRTSYIYYMIVVMPGIYLSVIYLVALGWRTRRRWLQAGIGLWGATVLSAAILMFPFLAVF